MTSQKQQLNEQKMINHLSTVGILGNVILTAFKLLAGIIGHSGAMISDAVHSLSDVFATFIAFSLCCLIRSGSVTEPRIINHALNGLMVAPKLTCDCARIKSKYSFLPMIAPPIASPCPLMYLVKLSMVKSAPSSIGR